MKNKVVTVGETCTRVEGDTQQRGRRHVMVVWVWCANMWYMFSIPCARVLMVRVCSWCACAHVEHALRCVALWCMRTCGVVR
jgi:hypothetical protein